MKKPTLTRFTFLCEDIEQQLLESTNTSSVTGRKSSGILSKIFSYKRYISEDFDRLWTESVLPKLRVKLNDVLNSQNTLGIDFENFIDENSKEITDLPPGSMAGADNAPVIKLTYDIVPEERYNILKTIMDRSEDSESNISKFGIWQVPIQNKLNAAIKQSGILDLNMKLEVLAYPLANDKQDFSKNEKVITFNEKGFECVIFIWFDIANLKDMLKSDLSNSDVNIGAGVDLNNPQSNTTYDETELNDNIDKLNNDNSKIKIGSASITLGDRLEGTLTKAVKGLANYSLVSDIALAGFKKLFNTGNVKDSSEEPDKIKIYKTGESIPAALANVGNPYIECFSKVILEKWLYKTLYDRDITDGKDKPKNLTAIYRYQFKDSNLKNDITRSPLTPEIGNPKVWSAGSHFSGIHWPNSPITESDLINGNIDAITCRIQYYTDASHNFYFEYRSTIKLEEWFNICRMIQDTYEDILSDVPDFRKVLLKPDKTKHDMINKYVLFADYILDNQNEYKYKTPGKSFDTIKLTGFNDWWEERFLAENYQGPSQSNINIQCISQKHLFTNKNKTFDNASSDTLRRTFKNWQTYDSSAFGYFQRHLYNKGKILTLNGTPLNDILLLPKFNNLKTDSPDVHNIIESYYNMKTGNNASNVSP